MAGSGLALPPGVGGDRNNQKAPEWAPREGDFVADGRVCPFASSPWGSAIMAGPGTIGHMAGMSYTRCHSRCQLFVPQPGHHQLESLKARDESKPSAVGTCAISYAGAK